MNCGARSAARGGALCGGSRVGAIRAQVRVGIMKVVCHNAARRFIRISPACPARRAQCGGNSDGSCSNHAAVSLWHGALLAILDAQRTKNTLFSAKNGLKTHGDMLSPLGSGLGGAPAIHGLKRKKLIVLRGQRGCAAFCPIEEALEPCCRPPEGPAAVASLVVSGPWSKPSWSARMLSDVRLLANSC